MIFPVCFSQKHFFFNCDVVYLKYNHLSYFLPALMGIIISNMREKCFPELILHHSRIYLYGSL